MVLGGVEHNEKVRRTSLSIHDSVRSVTVLIMSGPPNGLRQVRSSIPVACDPLPCTHLRSCDVSPSRD